MLNLCVTFALTLGKIIGFILAFEVVVASLAFGCWRFTCLPSHSGEYDPAAYSAWFGL